MASSYPVFKWSGFLVFKWDSNAGPFGILPLFDHLNTKVFYINFQTDMVFGKLRAIVPLHSELSSSLVRIRCPTTGIRYSHFYDFTQNAEILAGYTNK